MSGLVVVAVPADDDPIWQVSSEKAPHMTLLWFGDGDNVASADIGSLKGAVRRAAASLPAEGITATVESREKLGDDDADVVMVNPDRIGAARDEMLDDEIVSAMFDAVEQYPKWTPHVTLGYPATPANGEPGDTIRFDRLAVWDGDYEGEEYPMGAGMTASWVPFAMTAAAGIAAPLVDFKSKNRVRIYLPLAQDDASSLVIDGVVGHNLSLPVLEIADINDLTEGQQARLVSIVEDIAMSRPAPLVGDLGTEYGVTGGKLWTKPDLDGLAAIRARLVSALAQNNIPFDRLMPDAVVNFAYIGNNAVPEHLTQVTPRRVAFNRISLRLGEKTYSYPFGVMGSGMLASGLVVDGDAMGELSEIDPNFEFDSEGRMGARFRIPLLVPEGVPTGDGRIFKPMSLRTRDFPLPLLWQIKTSDGHDGSVVVGRIDSIDRVKNGLGNAYGVFDTGPYGRECERMRREGKLRTLSVAMEGNVLHSVILGDMRGLVASGDSSMTFSNDGLTSFHIPVLVPTDTPTGDGRYFTKKSLSHRKLPIPLLWQRQTADGHDGSIVVGRIDSIEVRDDGLYNARGFLDNGKDGREYERLVRRGMLRGVSADLDQFEAAVDGDDADTALGGESETQIKSKTIKVTKARAMAVTGVPKPAFEEAYIILDSPAQADEEFQHHARA